MNTEINGISEISLKIQEYMRSHGYGSSEFIKTLGKIDNTNKGQHENRIRISNFAKFYF